MIKPNLKKILIIFLFIPLLASSCKKKADNFDIDLSNFKPANNNLKIVKEESKNIPKEEVINKLLPLLNRDEVSASIKYGKKDPFSYLENESNQTISYLQIKGFISIGKKNFAFVNFLNEEGVITINSVGGLNTKLLPNKAIVKEINPSKEEINISIEGVDYFLKLSSI